MHNIAKSRLAVMAGIPEGIVRNIDNDNWNPTLNTLRKLSKVIPDNFATSNTKKLPKTKRTQNLENEAFQ